MSSGGSSRLGRPRELDVEVTLNSMPEAAAEEDSETHILEDESAIDSLHEDADHIIFEETLNTSNRAITLPESSQNIATSSMAKPRTENSPNGLFGVPFYAFGIVGAVSITALIIGTILLKRRNFRRRFADDDSVHVSESYLKEMWIVSAGRNERGEDTTQNEN